MAAGRAGRYTIERQDGNVLKIEILEDNIITAYTGAAGLGQRFNDQVATTIKSLRQAFQPPRQVPGVGVIGTPFQQALFNKVRAGDIPYNVIAAVEIGRIVAQMVIGDFQRTQSVQQQSTNGWGLGGLFAFVSADEPQLIDFDTVQFHPELHGLPDPKRGIKIESGVASQWELASSWQMHFLRTRIAYCLAIRRQR
jgi:hypothetical protein